MERLTKIFLGSRHPDETSRPSEKQSLKYIVLGLLNNGLLRNMFLNVYTYLLCFCYNSPMFTLPHPHKIYKLIKL